jgi:hypothetical protein
MWGQVSEQAVAEAEAEARAVVSAAKPGTVCLLLDLRGVTTATLKARDALVAMQQALAQRLRQTAYVADTPAGRGLSLWVRHTVQDQAIKAVASREEALAWLTADPGPTTGVRPVVPGRRKTPANGTRRAAG